jgi:spore germination cell wall hydrolase CwlJ-like protein
MTAPGDATLVKWPLEGDASWIDAMNVAERVFRLGGCDNTQGSTMYCNLDVCNPPWAKTMKETVKIGHHTFFR